MKIIVGLQCMLVAVLAGSAFASVAGLLPAWTLLCCAGGVMCISIVAGIAMARATSEPYVATVLRMEALARGDLSSEIKFTNYTDCVGRMTKAMYSFREAAQARIRAESGAEETRSKAETERLDRDREKAKHAAEIDSAIAILAGGLAKLADGDLTARVEQPLVGDLDRLRNDFNLSMDRLQEAMTAVGGSGMGIRNGSQEVVSAADELARRTEKQAANLEESAAAIASITSTVKKTAEGALHARDVVATAKSEAEASGRVANEAVEAMKGIATSSRQIGQIIGVIDEIAFQTNLLALNAGVEAARAGDAGKGFAVVASEVRALAQRSAEAAKEIKALISTSATHVEQGVGLVAETGAALEKIVALVAEVNEVVVTIATSAQEQSVGLQEINTAVVQMDQMTQQNAAMVEESTAASHAMTQEADNLVSLLSKFQVGAKADVLEFGRGPATKRAQPAPAARSSAPWPGKSATARQLQLAEPAEDWKEF